MTFLLCVVLLNVTSALPVVVYVTFDFRVSTSYCIATSLSSKITYVHNAVTYCWKCGYLRIKANLNTVILHTLAMRNCGQKLFGSLYMYTDCVSTYCNVPVVQNNIHI